MSVESSSGGGTTGTRSRRARFREWRHNRPFAGGVLLMLAGLLIAYVPMQFAFELLLVGGAYTFIGLAWAVGVFLTGAFVLYRPEFSTIFGVLGVVLSILSLLGALGGLLLGMILGIIGGNLCVAWRRPDAAGGDGGGGPGDDGRPARTDGGSPPDRGDPTGDGESTSRLARLAALAGASPLSWRRSDGADAGGSSRAAYLERVRRFARRGSPDRGASLWWAPSPAAPGRLLDAATVAGPSRRLAVTVAVLVAASGTLTLVTAVPAAAILGDQEETTYTVDVGEIRLGEGGRICAASVGSDTYRVTITNATLVDTTFYQQRGDDAVKTDFPSVQVDDAMVMYTRGGDEQLDLLATTVGCTDEDQTSRTVFLNRYQTGERLRGIEGVTMLNMEATDAAVPEPGGFRFVAPGEENGTSPDPDVTGVADGIDDVVDGDLVDRLTNDTADLEPAGGAVEDVEETAGNATDEPGVDAVENATSGATNATDDAVSSVEESVDNTTGEVTGTDPPANASGAVDETTDTVDNTTGEVTGTTDDVTDAADGAVNDTADATNGTGEVSNATDEATGTVDEPTDAVDDTAETVEGTTDAATDGVDDAATDGVDDPTDDGGTSTPTATAEEDADRPDWLEQVDDEAAVLETVEETPGDLGDVENVTTETESLTDEQVAADDNLTRLDNGTVLLLNGTDPADVEWATDLLDDPDAATVGTETVRTQTPDDEESEAESADDSVVGAAG